MGDEVEFLPADKHKSYLQNGSITLSVISQTDPKYQKQSVYNIFTISQGKHEGWSCFFCLLTNVEGFFEGMKACYKLILRFFDGYGLVFPKFPKKQVCNVITISLKKLEIKLTFLMQINIKVS